MLSNPFFFYQILKIQFDHFSQLCSCLYTINALVYTCRNQFDLLESDKHAFHCHCIFTVYNKNCHINILMCLAFYYSAYITFNGEKKIYKQIVASDTCSRSWPMFQYHEWCTNHCLGISDWNTMLEKCSVCVYVYVCVFQLSSGTSPATLTLELELMAECCRVAGPFQGTWTH